MRGTWLVVLALLAGCGPGGGGIEWQPVQENLEGAILSFWGTSAEDIFAVGGPLAMDGGQAFVTHYDGTAWTPMEAGSGPSLWWVHGFASNDVWAVGNRGVILHYDGVTWSTVVEGTFDYTLWGVWGASPSELWAVGGTVSSSEPSVIRHYNGSTWEDVPGLGMPGELLFKVWGTAADDAWIIGTGGAILHYDGSMWSRVESNTTARLLTVRGRGPDDVYAVGGLSSATVIHYDGTRWSEVPVEPVQGLMGVWTAPGQPVVASGARGILMDGDGARLRLYPEIVTTLCLHAVWSDGEGLFLSGGGNLLSETAPQGIILASRPMP